MDPAGVYMSNTKYKFICVFKSHFKAHMHYDQCKIFENTDTHIHERIHASFLRKICKPGKLSDMTEQWPDPWSPFSTMGGELVQTLAVISVIN